jgi:hypothetical protein
MTTFDEKCCPRARIQIGFVEDLDDSRQDHLEGGGFTLHRWLDGKLQPLYASSEIEIERGVPKKLSGQARDEWIASRKVELKNEEERISAEWAVKAVIAQASLDVAVDIDHFKNDLDWARVHFETRQAVALRRRITSRLISIHGAAKKLSTLLADSEILEVLAGRITGQFLAADGENCKMLEEGTGDTAADPNVPLTTPSVPPPHRAASDMPLTRPAVAQAPALAPIAVPAPGSPSPVNAAPPAPVKPAPTVDPASPLQQSTGLPEKNAASVAVSIDELQRNLDLLANVAVPPPLAGGPSSIIEEGLSRDLGIGRSSAFDWLVGERLPEIYEKHFFPRKSGVSRNSGKVTGPYIRFVTSVLALLSIDHNGKPYKAGSIARALTAAKSSAGQRVKKTRKRQKSGK